MCRSRIVLWDQAGGGGPIQQSNDEDDLRGQTGRGAAGKTPAACSERREPPARPSWRTSSTGRRVGAGTHSLLQEPASDSGAASLGREQPCHFREPPDRSLCGRDPHVRRSVCAWGSETHVTDDRTVRSRRRGGTAASARTARSHHWRHEGSEAQRRRTSRTTCEPRHSGLPQRVRTSEAPVRCHSWQPTSAAARGTRRPVPADPTDRCVEAPQRARRQDSRDSRRRSPRRFATRTGSRRSAPRYVMDPPGRSTNKGEAPSRHRRAYDWNADGVVARVRTGSNFFRRARSPAGPRRVRPTGSPSRGRRVSQRRVQAVGAHRT